MNDKKIDELITKKSGLLLECDMELAKIKPNKTKAKKLFAKAAPLEEKIGDELADRGRLFDAYINWVSAGTCYNQSRQTENAAQVYKKIIRAALEQPDIIPEDVVRYAKKYISKHS
ncbi:hypothetical protein HY484_02930 [Candidatus Woesearchaeota archaeon]|nr:hypothetical protein [Candidatus Woesearchaeota archaeon]